MKKSTVYDMIFLVAAALIIILIHQFGWSEILSNYSVVVVLIAYFCGKYVRGVELKKKSKE
jgi:hypothetical protein